ncbi:hypothetical protein HNO51_12475 [Billgrantia sulfidoxydans]|uniref:Uncharacterized protein n=1 Tax=Billgrantia sulfidoxydans TaxID=2733484 RepID=A0ABX7W8U7_9GAMM|nr:hypothetical protein [Halomonas sulfidoxydans]QTP55424.1 hypothetical protein HNO51_12475 [Halomonas sulfidoxydans]
MANNHIDSLMVELGLDSDVQSFRQAETMFNGVRSAALQFAAAVGGGFGMQQLTMGFAQHYDQLGRYTNRLDVSAEYASNLAYVLDQVGGNAIDAQGALETMTGWLDDLKQGKGTDVLVALQMHGIDSSVIMGAQDAADAVERLSMATAGMDTQRLRSMLSSLGMGSLFNLFDAGPETFQSLMQDAQRLRPVTQNMIQTAQDFNSSLGKLSHSIGGVSDEISERILPDLSEALDRFAETLADNREQFGEGFEEALPYIKATAAGIGVLVAAEAGRKGLGMMGGAVGTGTTLVGAAGIGGLMSMWNWTAEDVNEAFGIDLPDWLFTPIEDLVPDNLPRPELRGPNTGALNLPQLRRERQPSAVELEPEFQLRQPSAVDAAWSDLMRSGIDRGADTWIPDLHPETLDTIQQMQRGGVPGGIGGDELQRGLNMDALDAIRERQERGTFTPEDREYLRQQMRESFPERYQGSQTNHFHINGATDPEAVAAAVDRRLSTHATQAARDWQEPYA